MSHWGKDRRLTSSEGYPGTDGWGWACSSLVHVAAVAALSWWTLPGPASRLVPRVDAQWGPLEAPEPTLPPPIEFSTPSASEGGAALTHPTLTPAVVIEPRLTFDARVPPMPGPLVEEADLLERVPALPPSARGGTGGGSGAGTGRGGAFSPSPEFFPMTSPTGRYVFVVDCSQSMNHRYPGPAKTRLGRVKLELWRAIYRMSPEQKYFIVFFNSRALPMPAEGLVPGGPEGQQEFFHWTAGLRANGLTDPYDALLLAVRLQPDEIFFLTDGEFNYRAVREVTKANFGGIRIHTIALGDDSGARFLEEIAARNNGTYRHIVPEQDHYWAEEPAAGPAPAPDTSVSADRQ